MGLAPEQKLIIKHTFLEYVREQGPLDCKSLRRRSSTEPAIDLDFLFAVDEKVFHGIDGGGDAVDEADHLESSRADEPSTVVPATPEASPLCCPSSWHMSLPQDKSWGECLPAAWCTEASAAFEGYASYEWWMPIPYDVNLGMPISHCSPMEQHQFRAQCPTTDHMYNPRSAADVCPAAPCVEKELPSIAAAPSLADAMQGDAENGAKETRTTVMLRGLPERYARTMILQLLDAEGFFGRYNFLYLPVDFKRQKNLGYALVNLVSPAEALRFGRHFEGFSGWNVPCDSIGSVAWCSPQQGLQAHIERYRNSPVMHESVPEEWRPLFLAHGVPISFPPPTTKIKAPRLKGIQFQ